jgi:hypothetical protein
MRHGCVALPHDAAQPAIVSVAAVLILRLAPPCWCLSAEIFPFIDGGQISFMFVTAGTN